MIKEVVASLFERDVKERLKVYENGYDDGYKQAVRDLKPVIDRLEEKK